MKRKKNKVRTLGDHERELRIRDKKLEEEAEKQRLALYDKKRKEGKRLKQNSPSTIQKRGTNYCQDCGKEKPIAEFYAYFDDFGALIKIFPTCKICDRKRHRGNRLIIMQEQRKLCLEYYSKRTKNKQLRCSSCKTKTFELLTLFDSRYKNNKAIADEKIYRKLVNFNYPDIKYKILCYNCAFQHIHQETKR